MTQVCVIFGAGEYYAGTPVVPTGAYAIAADGGLDHTRELGIVPDVVVGDFDSLEGQPPRTDVRTIALPALKDDPDMLSALKVGWSAGRPNSVISYLWRFRLAAALTIRFLAFS